MTSAVLPSTELHGRVTAFLYHEAELLDANRFAEWLELLAPEIEYRMPVRTTKFLLDGDGFEDFSKRHRPVLTGQQFQSANVDPVYILMEDFTHVKFYRRSFFDVVQDESGPFEGITHVDGWVPNQLVTATHGDPLPR